MPDPSTSAAGRGPHRRNGGAQMACRPGSCSLIASAALCILRGRLPSWRAAQRGIRSMSRFATAQLHPVVIAIGGRVGLTLWAPPWVGAAGDEEQGFLGDGGFVLAFD